MQKKAISEKKPYHTPKLKEYGVVQRVTLSTGLTNGDGGATMMT